MDQDSVLDSLSRTAFRSEKREKVAEAMATFIAEQVAQEVSRVQRELGAVGPSTRAAPAPAEPDVPDEPRPPGTDPEPARRRAGPARR